jgi:hypothetical protein
MFVLTIEAPADPVSILTPSPSTSWHAGNRYGDRPVVRWAALSDSLLGPGTSSPLLWFTAVGLPGIVDAHVEGYYELPEMSEDDPELDNMEDPLVVNSVPLRVVGIEPVPVHPSLLSLAARLDSLTREACSLDWITRANLCTTLRGHLSEQRLGLESFQRDLIAGHAPVGPVTDNAYWLLKVNADYIMESARKR